MASQSVDVLIEGGKATAAPPLGPALGPLGVNIGQVVADINKKTESFKGMQVPVKVTVDDAKQYTITIGTPPASALIKQESQIKKGSGKPSAEHVADLKIEQIIKIAKMKEDALLGKDLKQKVKEIVGTCQSMGVMVEGKPAHEAIHAINKGDFDKEIKAEKTEITAAEQKELEEERKKLQEDLAAKYAEYETKIKGILGEMTGKPRAEIKAKMHEAGIPEDLITKHLPAETPDAAKPAAGKPPSGKGTAK